jgi:outer membrane protein TolC
MMKPSYIIKKIGLMTILVLAFECLRAQVVVSLDTVLQVIEENNPGLQEYDQKIKALEAYSKGSTSWMAPMVGVGPYWYPYPNQMLMSERDEGMIMATVEQDIPNPAKLKAKRNFYESKTGIEQEGKAVRFNQLRAEAKQHYFNTLIAHQQLKVLKESQEIIELMIKLARIRYPYNQGSLGSIYKAEGRLHEVNNMRLMTEGEIESNLFRLKALMNLPEDAKIVIDTATAPAFTPEQMVDTASLAERRSDIRQMNESINNMRLNQQLQRTSAKPDFRIRFEHMQPRNNQMPTQFSAMAMITIPIAPWASKMYRSEVKGMSYDIQAMQKSRTAMLNETRGMLLSMQSQLLRMQEQLNNYEKKIIPALRKNYQTLMIGYEENREQLPIVIDAWETLNMSQMEYLQKERDFYTMIVSYEKEIEK